MRPEEYSIEKEQRKYIRLDSVFPVQFCIIDRRSGSALSEWLQGFTNNISKGGICLFANNLTPQVLDLLNAHTALLSLQIEIPFSKKTVKAKAGISWVKELPDFPGRYLMGLSYEEIAPLENNKIIRYALTKRLFAPALFTVILLLFLVIVVNSLKQKRLIEGNRALTQQLIRIEQQKDEAQEQISRIEGQKKDAELKMQGLEARIQSAEEELIKAEEQAEEAERLKNLVQDLTGQRNTLSERLAKLESEEQEAATEIQQMDKRRAALEEIHFEKMYEWIKIRQNPRTGLVMSFEGDSDIAKWAFTYDQALAIQAFTFFSDNARAKKTLDFFKRRAKRKDGWFMNAYYADDGEPAEYLLHSGPNIWLGIAVMQYTKKTADAAYLGLAEEIAVKLINLQNQDAESGIKGGPENNWYSTEHNLDAYAFFNMLFEFTRKEIYQKSRDKAFDWLVKHTYDRQDIPVKRGKGDATIATDTYAWSIAAIGAEKLKTSGMDPDKIIEFAEKECLVEAAFIRPDGTSIKIKGFDFSADTNAGRGAVISSEWTAQMILAFKVMGEYYNQRKETDKAKLYNLKAQGYLSELCNMIISSPSPSGQGESCLPYATAEFVDTGHGWRTPKGNCTGSLSATAYALFAYLNYNPLQFKD
ncbi:MAG: hypothetical protein AB1481_05175 [Candidatus Omnitrophota bacterium]